jgi:hypothetical protein
MHLGTGEQQKHWIYPISRALALVWYTAIDQSAADKRWAFAMSAKDVCRSCHKSGPPAQLLLRARIVPLKNKQDSQRNK